MAEVGPRVRRATQCTVAALALALGVPWQAVLADPGGATGSVAPVKPANRPAETRSDPTSEAAIVTAIRELGSEDYSVRERGLRTLWDAGEPAIAALKAATLAEDPEVASRARRIIASLAYGVRPDTSPAVLRLLTTFLASDAATRRLIIPRLAEQNPDGVRVLVRLADSTELDPMARDQVVRSLAEVSRAAAPKLLIRGEYNTTERLLELTSGSSISAARDYAAFLLIRSKLDARLAAELRPDTDGPVQDPAALAARSIAPQGRHLRLAALHRAAGDAASAANAADSAGDTALADLYLADAGRWADLADRVVRRGVSDVSVEELGYATAYHRLAGRRDEAHKYAAKLAKLGITSPDEERDVVEGLMLNGYPHLALDLMDHRDHAAEAVDFLTARLEVQRAADLVDRAKKASPPNLPMVLAQSLSVMAFQGNKAKAAERAVSVAGGDEGNVDLDTWLELIGSAPSVGVQQVVVDEWVARQAMANPQAEIRERLFRRARIGDADRAVHWFAAFRDQRVNLAPVKAVALIRDIDHRKLPTAEVLAIIDRTAQHAETLPRAERARRLEMLADVLADYDKIPDAIARQKEACGITDTAAASMRLGDFLARNKSWSEAANAYDHALQLTDGIDASAMVLKGWALMQAGDKETGQKLMELAHLIPLSDEGERHEMIGALERNKLTDDALREHRYINRVGDGKQWAFTDSLRRLAARTARGSHPIGAEPGPDADATAAADMWERAFLANLSKQMSFVETSANLTIPSLIRRARAVGAAKAGKLDDAVATAGDILAIHPGDTDSQIAIVRALDRAKAQDKADTVHKKAFAAYEEVRKLLPNSAAAHNLVAWLCGCTRRDLDHGLAMAKRAVELDPDNASILDTLSEVHYARKEYDDALKVNARCRELEPWADHHKRNLARFTAAKSGRPTDAPLEGEDD